VIIEYEWKGNVRELENTVESILVIHSPAVVDLPHLPQEIQEFREKPEVIPIRIGTPLEEVERELLVQTLKATQRKQAACGRTARHQRSDDSPQTRGPSGIGFDLEIISKQLFPPAVRQ